jgi:hypothetical protein
MAKMSLLSAISNRLMVAVRQGRIVVESVAVGIYVRAFGFLEFIGILDDSQIEVDKVAEDSVSLIDQSAKSFTTSKEDVAGVEDVSVISPAKVLSDGAQTADETTQDFGKGNADGLLLSDVKALAVAKDIIEEMFATDDLEGEASADDEQNIAFFTSKQNSAQSTDTLTLLAGSVQNDIISLTDSGLLLNQDYVDNPFYFADDYVGTKRTF